MFRHLPVAKIEIVLQKRSQCVLVYAYSSVSKERGFLIVIVIGEVDFSENPIIGGQNKRGG